MKRLLFLPFLCWCLSAWAQLPIPLTPPAGITFYCQLDSGISPWPPSSYDSCVRRYSSIWAQTNSGNLCQNHGNGAYMPTAARYVVTWFRQSPNNSMMYTSFRTYTCPDGYTQTVSDGPFNDGGYSGVAAACPGNTSLDPNNPNACYCPAIAISTFTVYQYWNTDWWTCLPDGDRTFYGIQPND